jgi:hypothetical protein
VTEQTQLVFDGSGAALHRLDARKALSVALGYVEALAAVATFEWAIDSSPFIPTFTEITRGSIAYHFGFVPDRLSEDEARRCWNSASRRLGDYAQVADDSPAKLRTKLRHLLEVTRELPANVNAYVNHDGWRWSISEVASRPPAPVTTSTSKFRARIIKVGGKKPRIQLATRGDTILFTVHAPMDLALRAGNLLYKTVDVSAKLTRLLKPPNYPVIDGELLDIIELSDADPVAAFDKWYKDIGRPLLDEADDTGPSSHG